MTMAMRDTKKPGWHQQDTSPTLRGNQLAQALTKAPLPPQLKAHLFKAVEVDEAKVLADVRVFLARLVSGDRIPTTKITTHAPVSHRQAIVKRLKLRGLIEIRFGHYGGAVATPRLVELARANIGDDELRALAMTELSDEERAVLRKAEEAAPPPQEPSKHPPFDSKPLPMSRAARDVELLKRIRAWLRHGATGARLQVSSIAGAAASNVYLMIYRIRDAGYIEKQGINGRAWYVVPEQLRDHVRSLSDEQIVALIWPGRVSTEVAALMRKSAPEAQAEEPPQQEPQDEVAEAIDSEQIEIARRDQIATEAEQPPPAPPPSGGELEALLSRFLDVMMRLDARFARMERELGLKPIEQEASK